MVSIGAEVGQKMRSAIKAKLMELNCYVDDELPDYIMVMVANKRSKSQMNEDLQLFLTSKTATFVDWLHIVLKKLKEVSVTNPEVYKKIAKRKSDDILKGEVKVKKEKKDKIKSEKKSKKKDSAKPVIQDIPQLKSLTDDLPININKLQEKRKVLVMQESQHTSGSENVNEDNFDIPLLSEVNLSNEAELEDIERKIKSVKSRLGLLVESDSDDNDCINIKAEPEDLFPNEMITNRSKDQKQASETQRKIKLIRNSSVEEKSSQEELNKNQQEKVQHARITFNSVNSSMVEKKKSVHERLGKRSLNTEGEVVPKKTKINYADSHLDKEENFSNKNIKDKDVNNSKNDFEDHFRESALNRLGVMSKVSVPAKEVDETAEIKQKEVPSIVKIKPRVIPPNAKQANKNLLLKAVAEAQRSIAQTPTVGNNLKPDALFTKKYKEQLNETKSLKKLSEKEKTKIKNIIVQVSDNKKFYNNEFSQADQEESNSTRLDTNQDFSPSKKISEQQFIVTLDGVDENTFKNKSNDNLVEHIKLKIQNTVEKRNRKTPSPIVFNSLSNNIKLKHNVPDDLPIVQSSPLIKNKERCKYWPTCRHGDKCEFVHPSAPCKLFPQCKFGDKCLFLHPTCKFEQSCTRRDCQYSHISSLKTITSRVTSSVPSSTPTCKYFPNCSNSHCTYYHPKLCKYGKYCNNQSECNFIHTFMPTKSNLTWRSSFN